MACGHSWDISPLQGWMCYACNLSMGCVFITPAVFGLRLIQRPLLCLKKKGELTMVCNFVFREAGAAYVVY